MTDLAYRTAKGFFTALAMLPLSVLYVLADLIYFLIYHIVRYRRRLVDGNLRACFPDKDEAWIKSVRQRFYRNFADSIVETIKLLHISDEEISRRVTFENLGLIEQLTAQKQSVVLYFSHCFNWEWAPSMTLHVARHSSEGVEYCQVYRPLRNKTFDRLMLGIRSRFGSLSFKKSSVLRDLIMLKKKGIASVTGFMSDQKPSHGDPTVVTTFLNRPTAFISGTETLARKLGFAALYWDVDRLSRGHYRITCRPISLKPEETAPGEITRIYAKLLENTILRNPPEWLWTHNRWKIPVKLPQE